MKKIFIFCEGKIDQYFIKDFLVFNFKISFTKTENSLHSLGYKYNIIIYDIDGCDNLENKIYIEKIKDNTLEDGFNIVIVDSDKIGVGNNGFENCKKKLDSFKRRHDIVFNYFLWPDNSSEGDIEDLLIQLIPLDKTPVLECIKKQAECLKSISGLNLKIPENKAIINAYLYHCKENPGVEKRNYLDTNHWNLENSINTLELLKSFFLESIK